MPDSFSIQRILLKESFGYISLGNFVLENSKPISFSLFPFVAACF